MRLVSKKKGAFLIRLLYLHIIRVISVGSFYITPYEVSGLIALPEGIL
jgi:hypothetical protein